jgi:hypothetical protein
VARLSFDVSTADEAHVAKAVGDADTTFSRVCALTFTMATPLTVSTRTATLRELRANLESVLNEGNCHAIEKIVIRLTDHILQELIVIQPATACPARSCFCRTRWLGPLRSKASSGAHSKESPTVKTCCFQQDDSLVDLNFNTVQPESSFGVRDMRG